MPSIPLHPPAPPPSTASDIPNPLPQLLQTPSGLALLEIQGTIHTQTAAADPAAHHPVGKLVFPLLDAGDDSNAWMKRVHLYVGKHQRLTGEVKALAKPVAVIRRRDDGGEEGREELEVVEVVRWKVLFSGRPEPVS